MCLVYENNLLDGSESISKEFADDTPPFSKISDLDKSDTVYPDTDKQATEESFSQKRGKSLPSLTIFNSNNVLTFP